MHAFSRCALTSLHLGGNAVDAAISASLCLGIVSPGSSGLGGGSFLLFYNSTDATSTFIDGRETAPAQASRDMYVADPSMSYGGGLSIGVPGQIHALRKAWELHGKADWYDVVVSSSKMARRFQVSSTLEGHINKIKKELLSDKRYNNLRKYLNGRYNRLARAGDYLENPALENTLIMLAGKGPSYLYTGRTGAVLAEEIIAAGGIITEQDLEDYVAVSRDPVRTEVLGYTYYGAPPPSSGGLTLATILKYMEGFRAPLVSQGGVYFHNLVEAFKHAFALRMSLGDPQFINVSTVSAAMLDQDYVDALREGDDPMTVDPDPESYGGPEATGNRHGRRMVEDHGTSHLR